MHHLSLQKTLSAAFAMVMCCLLIGCVGTPTLGELGSRGDVQKVLTKYRPNGVAPNLPRLKSGGSPETYEHT